MDWYLNLLQRASLTRWLSGRLQTKWLWVQIPLQSLKIQISRLFWARSPLIFRQLYIYLYIYKIILYYIIKYIYIYICIKNVVNTNCLKVESQLSDSDDLIIFKFFRVIFSLKKKTINFRFVQSLFSTKKSPKVVNLPLTDERLCLNFWRHKQDKWLFQLSKLSWGSYVSI